MALSWRGEKMKKQRYAIGYTPQLLVKSLTVTYKLMYESHPIGPLKNKQQLINAIEKAAGEELAEKAKR